MASPTSDRITALSNQLAEAHQELRRRLAALRAGRLGPDDLRTHCLAFCTALTTHHRGEDTGLFAALLRERPDLAPTIDNLIEDHGLITGILTRIASLAGANPAEAGDPATIQRELDGLTAIMESHFRYEERALATALDAGVPDTGWSTPVLRLRPPR
ncbi:hemerythrin domain-containing protein [Actinoplanes oblitus]|uniref:Hemerythrin domain-containing protein n=1 Tax=Actinoplanes oblitus TaxID=3040509 RepID=A0ABY8WN26_9ACTN|nr:hemerythrin domain-containing protein [Actinoplanes oblitus]WIM99274.1 hemerythrin domain-containing protein [Actinoplanes oblitus]